MLQLSIIQMICIWIIPMLFAITLHEAAHGFVAYRCGDNTARAMGRLSLNPMVHLDPIGSVVMPLVMAVLSGFQFIFGWAKPVPVQWHRLKHPQRDMVKVALAGPAANFIMALLWSWLAKVGFGFHPETSSLALFLVLTGQAGVSINLMLGWLNLIPLPPLDGSRVVRVLLPAHYADHYDQMEPYGVWILMFLLFTGVLGRVLMPLVHGSRVLLGV